MQHLAERGSNLSGDSARLAIARTILNNPQMLVMDGLRALDMILRNNYEIYRVGENRTVFFITHRLSTIRNSELILVMHQGNLVEKGNHEH